MTDREKEELVAEARETFNDRVAEELRQKLFSPDFDENAA